MDYTIAFPLVKPGEIPLSNTHRPSGGDPGGHLLSEHQNGPLERL